MLLSLVNISEPLHSRRKFTESIFIKITAYVSIIRSPPPSLIKGFYSTQKRATPHKHQLYDCVLLTYFYFLFFSIWDTIKRPFMGTHSPSSLPSSNSHLFSYFKHNTLFIHSFTTQNWRLEAFCSLRNQLRSTTDGDKTVLPRGI